MAEKVEVIEQYHELIERDNREISILWKLSQVVAYACSAISGEKFLPIKGSFGDSCVLWAVPARIIPPEGSSDDPGKKPAILRAIKHSINLDIHAWSEKITVDLGSPRYCSFCIMMNLSFCIYGVVGVAIFTICGRGGYDNRMRVGFSFREPWRLVVPSMLVSFVLAILSYVTLHHVGGGFQSFINELEQVFDTKGCVKVMKLAKPHYGRELAICNYFGIVQVTEWVIVGSWTSAFFNLILRVVNATDFRMLKVVVQKVPMDDANNPHGTNGFRRFLEDRNAVPTKTKHTRDTLENDADLPF